MSEHQYVKFFEEVGVKQVAEVGGKNCSLGEMINTGIPVPPGFAVTTNGYKYFLEQNNLTKFIENELFNLDVNNTQQLENASKRIREKMETCNLSPMMEKQIEEAAQHLYNMFGKEIPVAVRSSATAEDLPDASFAGEHDTFLNTRGIEKMKEKIIKCYASLFTPRAIFYRVEHGFDHMKVLLSAGIQTMIESEKAGVMFTHDVESGNPNNVTINSNYGIGESVVSGSITPDQHLVFKKTCAVISQKLGDKKMKTVYKKDASGTEMGPVPEDLQKQFCLSEDQVRQLTEIAIKIEEHYGKPMDTEWAIDKNGKIWMVQARPETVHSLGKVPSIYKLLETGERLAEGLAIGKRIGVGPFKWLNTHMEYDKFVKDDVLGTMMTTPDYVPIMKKASAITTVRGGITAHAAIVSRELQKTAVIGIGENLKEIPDGQVITVDCSTGKGIIYKGKLAFETKDVDYATIAKYLKTDTKIGMNMAVPELCMLYGQWAELYGLVRLEFLYESVIGIHPNSLREGEIERLKELTKDLRNKGTPNTKLEQDVAHVEEVTKGYRDRTQYFVDKLSEGISLIASSIHPREAIFRLSDLKTNEYRGLICGEPYEKLENNPMLGWRGASRYIDEDFEQAFRLECKALKIAIDKGLDNIKVMIPFARDWMYEVPRTLEIMKEEGLERGKNTQVYLMAETTPVLFYPERFMNYCDGYSIGSNDATQAILNIDRDNERFNKPILINSKGEKVPYFDETHPDVMDTFRRFIAIAKQYKKKTGICGEAPTTKPDDYPAFLYECGIDSISVSSDTWPLVKKLIYFEEMKRLNPEAAGFGYGYWAYNIDAWNSRKFEKKMKKMKSSSN